MATKAAKPSRDALRGGVLNPSVAIEQEFSAAIVAAVTRMCAETRRELLAVFSDAAYDAMDAKPVEGAIEGHVNISSQARIAVNRLVGKWEPMFGRLAKQTTKRMIDRTVTNSAVTLGMSLREISKSLTIDASAMSPKLLDIITASTNEAAGLIKIIPTKYLSAVQGAVMRSITSGQGLKELQPFLEKQYAGNVRHAKNVSLDQTRKAYTNITSARMADVGVKTYEWLHTGGSKEPRPDHVAMHGKVFRLDDPPVIDKRTGQRGKPGDAIFCLPAWSNVERAEGMHKLFRRPHTGPLSTLVTESGGFIDATANHPVLTARGWLPAQMVEVGDYVVRAHQKRKDAVESDVAHPVVAISELFDAAALAIGVSFSIPGRSELEFHGDASDGEIEVIDIDGFLPFELDAKLCERLVEFVLAWAHVGIAGLPLERERTPYETVMRALGAPDRIVRGLGPLLALLGGHSTHADDIRIRLAANIAARFGQPGTDGLAGNAELLGKLQLAQSANVQGHDLRVGEILAACGRAFDLGDDEPPRADELGQRVGMALQFGGDLFQSETCAEQFERVVEHRVDKEFSGHVFNLESPRGWYSTNGLIVHNCRCRMRPIVTFDAD